MGNCSLDDSIEVGAVGVLDPHTSAFNRKYDDLREGVWLVEGVACCEIGAKKSVIDAVGVFGSRGWGAL